MVSFQERLSNIRNRALVRVSNSPFLISYFVLIIPLTLLGVGLLSWERCQRWNCRNWNVQDDHLHLLAIFFASMVEPAGCLLLAPGSQRRALLSRLNPLLCIAEGVTTIFTLFALHFSSTNPLSYPAAATLLLYRRESSVLSPIQLNDLTSVSSTEKLTYSNTRLNLGFPPIEPRGIVSSASLYVFGLLGLIRLMAFKWVYLSAPVITMLAVFYIWSFGFLHLTILIATSRRLTTDEQENIEEEFNSYLQTYSLRLALSPSETSTKPARRFDLDDGWRRLVLFIVCFLVIAVSAMVLIQLATEGLPRLNRFGYYDGPQWPWNLFPWHTWRFVVAFPFTLLVSFGLMKAGTLRGRKGDGLYWAVAGLMIAINSSLWLFSY